MHDTTDDQIENISIALQLLAREAARRNPVTVAPAPGGGFDVVLHLDGTYRDWSDAAAVAAMLTEALVANAAPPNIMSFDEIRDANTGPGAGLIDLLAALTEGGEQ